MNKVNEYVWIFYYRKKDGNESYQLKHSMSLANIRKLAKHYRLKDDVECVQCFKLFSNV